MTTKRRRHGRNLVFTLVIIALLLLGIEILVRIAAAAGFCHIRTFQVASQAEDIQFVSDINQHFGVWHIPQTSVTVKTPKGEVSYEPNSSGLRACPGH